MKVKVIETIGYWIVTIIIAVGIMTCCVMQEYKSIHKTTMIFGGGK